MNARSETANISFMESVAVIGWSSAMNTQLSMMSRMMNMSKARLSTILMHTRRIGLLIPRNKNVDVPLYVALCVEWADA